MYAKLENGKLIYAPKNYDTGTNLILNFNKSEKLMKQYGFKGVVDSKPEYDSSTHYAVVTDYIENEDTIIINYELREINKIQANNEPTLEDRIIELEATVKEQSKMINTLLLSVNLKNK